MTWLGDFPDDVQLSILSFLSPADISSFASASTACASLCRRCEPRLWLAMCDRQFGSKTRIPEWNRNISHRLLYRTLSRWDHLIGFWRRSGSDPQLILFDWGPHFVSGSTISPATDGTYSVVKSPFLRLSLSPEGHQVSTFSDPSSSDGGGSLVPVCVSVVGRNHFVLEEEEEDGDGDGDSSPRSSSFKDLRQEEEFDGGDFGSPGSLPDRIVQIANKTSPVGERRQRRRREKERRARTRRRRKWDPQHFVKIVHCSPTPSQPLRGLWKGIFDDMKLGFYLIAYDDIGSITCRKVWNSPENDSSSGQLFWISNASALESPFSAEEQRLYRSRVHLRPVPDPDSIEFESLSLEQNSASVSRILYLNTSFDQTVPLSVGRARGSRFAEGRIWQYEDGTFGFGFLGDNSVTDLKVVSHNGCLLDAVEFSLD